MSALRGSVLAGVVGWALALSPGAAPIDDWCSAAEQTGELAPSPGCLEHVLLEVEVAGAAAPCWEQIPEDLPTDEWYAQRDACEAAAHLAVCGRARCY
jgi:hypothetical protein